MRDANIAATRRAGSPARRALQTGLRALELALATAGTACLLAYGLACARASLTQTVEGESFDRALEERLALLQREVPPDRSEWSSARVERYEASLAAPVEGAALGRLEIPEVGLSVMVLDGTDEVILDRAVGRIEGTARPGEPGNLGIAGHRDGYFRGLRHLAEGDEITLTTLDGVARYRVERTLVVSPERVDVLAPSDEPILTLVTCFPFYYVGDAPERFIVQARQVRFDAWTPDGRRAELAGSQPIREPDA